MTLYSLCTNIIGFLNKCLKFVDLVLPFHPRVSNSNVRIPMLSNSNLGIPRVRPCFSIFFFIFSQIFAMFDDFLMWNAFNVIENFEKSSKMTKFWEKMKKKSVSPMLETYIGNLCGKCVFHIGFRGSFSNSNLGFPMRVFQLQGRISEAREPTIEEMWHLQ